jgi:hypothetical protein
VGSRLRIANAQGVQVGMLPPTFDRALRDKRFLGTLPKDELSAFLRCANESELKECPLVPSGVALAALQVIESHLRERSLSDPQHENFGDVVVLQTRTGESVSRALLKTGFEKGSDDWRNYGAYSKTRLPSLEAPWAEFDEETSRWEALRMLGPLDVSAGVLQRPGHVQRSAPGKGVWYEAKEQLITLRFVSLCEGRWRALLASLAEQSDPLVRWADW